MARQRHELEPGDSQRRQRAVPVRRQPRRADTPAASILAAQRAAGNDAVSRTLLAAAGTGRPLDPAIRRDMEGTLGHNLGDVRVHTDALAAASAERLEAEAYTAGPHVVFGRERFAPHTAAGRALITHELTHVVEQRAALRSGRTPTVQRKAKTQGETTAERADTWLAVDAALKTEVDVLKTALREIQRDKSVAFNRAAGLDRIDAAARILNISKVDHAALRQRWTWLVDHRKSRHDSGYRTAEAAFFGDLKSPLARVADAHPKAAAKYWLRNAPVQVLEIVHAAADVEMPADQLFAYAAKEGLIDWVRQQAGLSRAADPTAAALGTVRVDRPISGFSHLGLDDFTTELRARRHPLSGMLPPGFDASAVTEEPQLNEKTRFVRSARFGNLATALQALGAVLRRRRRLFVEDAKALGYDAPTEDELMYWTYVYFNTGEFGGKAQLVKYAKKRRLSDWITRREYPNALTLLRGFRMLRDLKVF